MPGSWLVVDEMTCDPLPPIVEAARRGDDLAWASLVERFLGFAVAFALLQPLDARDRKQKPVLRQVLRFRPIGIPAPADLATVLSLTSAGHLSADLHERGARARRSRRRNVSGECGGDRAEVRPRSGSRRLDRAGRRAWARIPSSPS